MSSLYILEFNPLSFVSFTIIFSYSKGCLFTLFIVSFAVQKLLSLIRSYLFIFAFISNILGGGSLSLLFHMLSRLVITFLPRSKHLLISWLQSPPAVILEPPKIKSATVSIVSPSICHEVMGPDAMILVFWMLSFKPTFHSPLSLSSRGFLVLLHFLP